jgi:sporulation protein YlmC with PRC-barrel domain
MIIKNNKKSYVVETDLYELNLPGQFILKEVVDKDSKRIGVVRNIRLKFPQKVELIVKGIDIEVPIDFKNIQKVGTIIQLKSKIKIAEECDVSEVVRLRKEIEQEISEIYTG